MRFPANSQSQRWRHPSSVSKFHFEFRATWFENNIFDHIVRLSGTETIPIRSFLHPVFGATSYFPGNSLGTYFEVEILHNPETNYYYSNSRFQIILPYLLELKSGVSSQYSRADGFFQNISEFVGSSYRFLCKILIKS